MGYKRFRLFFLWPILLLVITAVFSGILFRTNRLLSLVQLGVVAACMVIYVVCYFIYKRQFQHILLHVSSRMDVSKKKSMDSFPLPAVVTDLQGEIIIFNKLFGQIFSRNSFENGELYRIFPELDCDEFPDEGLNIRFDNRFFTVFEDETIHKSQKVKIYYFVDDSQLKSTAIEYEQSRPYLLFLSFDGINEIQKNYSSNDFAEIKMLLDRIVGSWASGFNAVYDKMSAELYLIIAEKRNIDSMKTDKFGILEDVRSFTFHDKEVGVSLSIGISTGNTFSECESNARQALDMAQSRGGDQVAIRTSDGRYEFVGGIARGIENTNKVRTRIVASSVSELIRSSKNVMIMGHRFPDLDAMGAATALCSAALYMGVPAYIVTDPAKSLATPLLDRLRRDEMESCLMLPDDALSKIGKDTLLVVVDTHIGDFTEVPDLLTKTKKIVVIDHHRKSVQHIDNAVLFFHDPAASSASEMVAELMQYISTEPVVGKTEADALLSGIMLDTKNFVLRAGIRTFEAAAYLKKRGADTVQVKKMFSSSLDSYKQRNAIISESESYRNCAIATAKESSSEIRIICSQAADELLNISDVDASFVMFETAETVNISARSFGKINVQVIMEKLGGGGHQTMAAAQLKGIDVRTAQDKLKEAIDGYFETNSVH